jgi:hypothetical protein
VRMRVSLFIAMLLLTGCAGRPGPPFGPGPEVDTAFGILVILLFAGLLYRAAKGWQNPKHFEPPPFTLRARGMPEAIDERRVPEHDAGAPPNSIR